MHRWLSFSFSFFGRKWNFIFVGIFVYGRKWKIYFRSACRAYIKLFQITPYVNDFQTLNNPGSGQPVDAFKITFRPTLHFWHKPYILHHHHRRRVVRVNRCAAPWPLAISGLHSVDSSRALASEWTLLSQTLRGRPGGLLQLAIGFLSS